MPTALTGNVTGELTGGITGMDTLRPPLEKMLFLVGRPGESITAEWELFFFNFANFLFFWSKYSLFSLKKKKKKKNCSRPTGQNEVQ